MEELRVENLKVEVLMVEGGCIPCIFLSLCILAIQCMSFNHP